MKRLFLFIFTICALLFLGSCDNKENENLSVIATNYVGYDFARAVTKDTNAEVSMLLKPGAEIHGYEPSTKDIINILSCDVFIYVGGESDEEWVEKSILNQIDKEKTQVVNMFDVLKKSNHNLYLEEEIEGEETEEEEAEEEYDEHVWNDYNNAQTLVHGIEAAIIIADSKNEAKYKENANNYQNKINQELAKLADLMVKHSDRYMLVADRFPLLYFVKFFDIKYDAALSGCSSAQETSVKTLIRLKEKVEENNLKYIFTIELSTQNIAKALKQEIKHDIDSGTYDGKEPEILTIYSMHNISKEDFEAGLTFVDYMQKNYKTMVKYFG